MDEKTKDFELPPINRINQDSSVELPFNQTSMAKGKKKLSFLNDVDEKKITDHLVNDETLKKWIECAFNGNILTLKPLSQKSARQRWEKTMYID
jgi:hypothetical protein